MKNIFVFLPVFLLCVCFGNAQETIIKHTVSKGETVYQLSKKYNVTVEEIYALNPSAVDIIEIDDVLSIPKREEQSTASPSVKNNTNTNIITYAVVYGDTKYSLARRFGISVEDLELQNPHTKNGLQAGHILKIQSQQSNSSTPANYTIKKTHLVLKGQTLWGISKENELTVEQLVNANSEILKGILQIGQVLNIPTIYGSTNNGSSETYLVQHGDTKYGLSKKYNVTIDELEKTNPQIVRMLMTGQTIRIPNKSNVVVNETSNETIKTPEETRVVDSTKVEPTQQTASVDTVEEQITNQKVEESIPISESTQKSTPEKVTSSAFVDYEIQPKETLYGLSKKAEMSISDFVALNPELENGVKIGMIIKMPSDSSTPTQTTPNVETTIRNTNQKYVDLRSSIQSVKKNEILLFLPFSETQFTNDYTQSNNFKEISDDFIREHLEFYRGAKIAQDSARTLGLDFKIDIVETNNSKRNTKAAVLAKDMIAENYDALILPFYETETEEIAKLIKDKNIPVITTNSITQEEGLKNLFNGVPSLNSRRNRMLDYMNSKEGNLIIVFDIGRKESKTYISNYAPNAKFIEVNKKGNFNADELISQLDSKKINYVILESEKNSVFLSTTNLLLGQLSTYNIQLALLDKTLIPNADDVSNKRFVILQMLYPSLTPLTETTETSDFINSYKKSYNIEPTQNVKFGYDLTFDTLLRLSQAKSFESSATSDLSEYTSLKFDYKLNKMGNYDNTGIYIIQYNSDGSLKEIN